MFVDNVSFCSSKNHPAENLVNNDPAKKWKCSSWEKSVSVVLQLDRAVVINSIDIGNQHSAFIEVLVGRSSSPDEPFQVLLVASSFMSPMEARNGTMGTRVRMFSSEQLRKPVVEQRWDRVKVICSQPFNKHVQYEIVDDLEKKPELVPRKDVATAKNNLDVKVKRVEGPLGAKKQSITTPPAKQQSTTTPPAKQQSTTTPPAKQQSTTIPPAKCQRANENSFGTKQVMKRPQRKLFSKLLEGVVFVMSGYQNPHRAHIRTKALEMGAKYKTDWGVGCTHLICAFSNTPKFQQVRGRGHIVTKEWIEDCYNKRRRLPWRRVWYSGMIVISDVILLPGMVVISDVILLSGMIVISDVILLSGMVVISDVILSGMIVINDVILLSGMVVISDVILLSGMVVISDVILLSGMAVISDVILLSGMVVISDVILLSGMIVISDVILLSGMIVISDVILLSGMVVISVVILSGMIVISDVILLPGMIVISDVILLSGMIVISVVILLSGMIVISDVILFPVGLENGTGNYERPADSLGVKERTVNNSGSEECTSDSPDVKERTANDPGVQERTVDSSDSDTEDDIERVRTAQKDDSYSGDTDVETTNEVIKDNTPLPHLPTFFNKITFYLSADLNPDLRARLHRYIVAFKGKVSSDIDSKVDIIVSNSRNAAEEGQSTVPPQWVWDCCDKEQLLSTQT
uniref:BRCT domain-containing protein n=1 Tax=Timema tahoe TaxID=61484 RepID=A0A7R9FJ65_9NEOP|nr:unnamed protein product [Timema tahoe]